MKSSKGRDWCEHCQKKCECGKVSHIVTVAELQDSLDAFLANYGPRARDWPIFFHTSGRKGMRLLSTYEDTDEGSFHIDVGGPGE